MSSSPRQVPSSGSSIKTFEYPHSGPAKPNTLPGKSNGAEGLASQDIHQLLIEARAQGIQEGLRQAQQNADTRADELARVADTIRNFQQQASDYFGRVEVELVHLSLAIAAKILHREAQVDRMLVAGLVKVVLEKLQQGTKVTVRVHPEEAEACRAYFKTNLAGWLNLEVEGDSRVALRNCVLESELGEADLGIDAQLKEVELGFFDLLAQRPASK